MADVKISALNALGTAPAADDLLPVVDVSGVETKKLRIDELFTNPNVTGTVTADGLTVDNSGNGLVRINGATGSTEAVIFQRGGTEASRIAHSNSANLSFSTGSAVTNRMEIASNGDISFYEDTGTTAKFFWDASAESLGIGTSSPTNKLTVAGGIDFSASEFSGSGTGIWSPLTNELGFVTAGSTRLRIDSAGNVGIGNTVAGTLNAASAVSDLAVGDGSGTAGVTVYSGSASYGALCFADGTVSTSAYQAYLKFDHSNNALSYVQNNTERMRIDSSGNVGIGTASPNSYANFTTLTLDGTNGSEIDLEAAGTLRGQLYSTTSALGLQTGSATNLPIVLGTNGSERMRIDSSGNLLVGTTNSTHHTGSTDQGITLSKTFHGLMSASRSGAQPLILNRQTNDGTIADFRKDGTTVGSIGVASSNAYFGTGDTAIYTNATSDAVQPFNTSTSTVRDGLINLGSSGARFKDLYLSGGVYLGGTTSNNLLHDYEEGTWTPTYATSGAGFAALTMDVISAVYTKIGDLVTVSCYVRTDNVDITGASGSVILSGLPFTSANQAAGFVGYAGGFNAAPIGGYTSGTSIYLQDKTSISSSTFGLGVGDITNGAIADANQLIISVTYRTVA